MSQGTIPSAKSEAQPAGWRAIPGGVWALGFVSLFMDISSEMIHGLLPVFLVGVLGASTITVGLIEGIAEATASITKIWSGWLSDRLRRRKLLTVIGYSIGALSKPLFPLATSAGWVLTARFADRVGKGIRGAPRDALIGDITPPSIRGAAYGLRQSLDTVGAFAGPLLAIALMTLSGDNFRMVFWVAVVPAVIAVAILVVGVREPAPPPAKHVQTPIRVVDLRKLPRVYWGLVAVGAILTLARFSEAFLVLRAENLGLPLALAPLVLVVMNVVYAASAYPAGALSDRVNRHTVLAAGFGVLIVSDLLLAAATDVWFAMIGIGLWGLHMGLTQGLLAALIADTAPAELRGTGFGLFHLVSGVAMLLASLIAGLLWEFYGAPATFIAGAAFTIIGLLGVIALSRASASPAAD